MPPYPSTPRPGPGNFIESPRVAIQAGPGFGTSIQQRLPPAAPNGATAPAEELTPAERAARDINKSLAAVNETYSLEQEYGGRLAYNYEVRSATSPWSPFQKVRSYPIPDQIFEQLNRSQVAMNMGLFAELHYVWASIDNALYLWDYTQTNPELLGFEDQPHPITVVQLAKPKPGVFLDNIKHMIVLASTDQIMLLGLGKDAAAAAGDGLTLYKTGMSASIKGLQVNDIVCSAKTGRVFFGSDTDNDVRELRYQAQDSWFASRCSVANHTHTTIQQFTGALTNVFASRSNESIQQLEIDDSRNVLYTLSTRNSIRAFYISPDGLTLDYKASISMQTIHRSLEYSMQNGPLSDRTKLVSISALPEEETQSWVLMATTREGYRIYLSGGFSYQPRVLISLAHSHIRTPPLLSWNTDPAPTTVGQINTYLTRAKTATRFPPGYFFCSVERVQNAPEQQLFISVPDSHPDPQYIRPQQGTPECATWLKERDVKGQVMSIGFTEPYKGATSRPQGFGYELAVQFDYPIPEVAVLTNFGVHVLRRRRFVDSLAALIRSGGGQDGYQTEIQNLIVKYGRQEILADALAVACGQSVDTAMGSRINDPDVLEAARKIFIEHGGRPIVDQGRVNDLSAHIDAVRPSPRHDGAVRYVSRLIRSTWKQVIAKEDRSTAAGYQILCSVKAEKLRAVQENLVSLQKFFKANKTFIRGLSGPDDLARQPQASRDDELALQGEHRALTALVKFVTEMIEAISFILVLFEEKVVEIVPLLPEQSRASFMTLTFEQLVGTKTGNALARDLVKAIVNRNIARGSNVESIAEALRRKCGNFCSADDVVIFKAQEQLRRAAEAKDNAEYSRNLLNESLKLFEQVAGSLPQEYLHSAVTDYIALQFFAGAIQLSLKVASEKDKTNDATAWISDGRADNDPRKKRFEERSYCYNLVHTVIESIDGVMASQPAFVDGRPSLSTIRRDEAYDVISRSSDEVFLTNLYDWYLSRGEQDRLLSADSTFIVTYLQRRSAEDIVHADLLWKYYGNNSQFHEAAKVQFQLAQSSFALPVGRRLEYLSLARSNASISSAANSTQSRKTKQRLLTDINTLIEVASIQGEILARLQSDVRLQGERRNTTLAEIDGPIQSISDLFNKYADPAGYYDICLFIYAVADHRDPTQIKNTWQRYLDSIHEKAMNNTRNGQQTEDGQPSIAEAWETVSTEFYTVGKHLRNYEAVFSIPMLIEMFEHYNVSPAGLSAASQPQLREQEDGDIVSVHWIPEVFIELEVPLGTIYEALEGTFLNVSQNNVKLSDRRVILGDLLYVIERWMHASYSRVGSTLFDNDQSQARIQELLDFLADQNDAKSIGESEWQWAKVLRGRVTEMVS